MKRVGLVVLLTLVLTVVGCQSQGNSTSSISLRTAESSTPDDEDFEYRKIIEDYMWEETKDALSPYYELIGYKIENYEETRDNNYDATFFYKVYYKNYDKDPDTVPYIKEAKEKGDSNYETYYKEYLENKVMNMEIRAVGYSKDNIAIYQMIDPPSSKEKVWTEFDMEDIIISINN